jgi:hypothetical protein
MNPTPTTENSTEAVHEMNLPARLMNVYAAPGEVFDNVRARPFRAANWLVPALILIVVSWACSFLVFQQPAVEQQLKDMAVQSLEKQVNSGKLSAEQAEQAQAIAEKYAMVGSKVGAAAMPLFSGLAMPFILGVVVWLVGTKALNGQFSYMKAVEVSALAGMIVVLDTIVRSCLIILTGNVFASLSPVLLVKNYNPQEFSHALLGALNLMTFWALAVRSIALARLSGASTGRAAVWTFCLWAVYTGLTLAVGFGIQALVN